MEAILDRLYAIFHLFGWYWYDTAGKPPKRVDIEGALDRLVDDMDEIDGVTGIEAGRLFVTKTEDGALRVYVEVGEIQ